jgi:hypothetical protein
MTRRPAHGIRIQLNPSRAVNRFGATRPLNQIVVRQLAAPFSTVARVLSRLGLGRLRNLDPTTSPPLRVGAAW